MRAKKPVCSTCGSSFKVLKMWHVNLWLCRKHRVERRKGWFKKDKNAHFETLEELEEAYENSRLGFRTKGKWPEFKVFFRDVSGVRKSLREVADKYNVDLNRVCTWYRRASKFIHGRPTAHDRRALWAQENKLKRVKADAMADPCLFEAIRAAGLRGYAVRLIPCYDGQRLASYQKNRFIINGIRLSLHRDWKLAARSRKWSWKARTSRLHLSDCLLLQAGREKPRFFLVLVKEVSSKYMRNGDLIITIPVEGRNEWTKYEDNWRKVCGPPKLKMAKAALQPERAGSALAGEGSIA